MPRRRSINNAEYEESVEETGWLGSIQKLEKYSEKYNWVVEYTDKKEDYVLLLEKKIVLSLRHKPEILFYFFLHEIGHLLVAGDPLYSKKYDSSHKRTKHSLTYRVHQVQEEIEAWNTGFDLAEKLGLYVNKNKFECLKSKSLSGYMAWAAKNKIRSPQEIS